jgi:hypothetical protein
LNIVSKAEARATGATYYFTGVSCPKGHVAARYVSCKACKVCSKQRTRDAKKVRAYLTANKDRIREQARKHAGLPTPTRETPRRCECCGGPGGKLAMALDHCHSTGAFRGWLCGKCNCAIGKLGDNEEGLQRALAYLQTFRTTNDFSWMDA